MSILPVDYSSHDAVYRRLKSSGSLGWSNSDEYQRMWKCAAPALLSLKSQATPSVLELGCGAGNFSMLMERAGLVVTGIDISRTAIRWAQESANEQNARARFVVGNVVDLNDFGDETFDTVVDGHCLHCIVGPDRARCLSSVRRVLKRGGIFVVLTMCGEVRDERIRASYDEASGVVIVDGRPTRYIGSAEAIVEELETAGFEIESLTLHARKSDQDQDDLVAYCRKR